MPVAPIIGAVGSVAGGIAGRKGAKKAANIQAQAAREQQALLQRMYSENASNFETDIGAGDQSTARIMDLLGLSGNQVDATAMLRNTPGYQFRMGKRFGGVNTNAYARGLGNSGATQRALLATSQGIADQGFNNYMNQLGDVANRGIGSKAALAGVSTNFANSSNTITQNAADTGSNYQMFRADNFNNVLGEILRSGGQVFGSSYGRGK